MLLLLVHHLVLLHLLELLFLRIDLVEVDHLLVGQVPHVFANQHVRILLELGPGVRNHAERDQRHNGHPSKASASVFGVLFDMSEHPSAIYRCSESVHQ